MPGTSPTRWRTHTTCRTATASSSIVTMHTLISHVDDPTQVLREAHRVVRPGGTVAVFDGDYASLTFAYPDHAVATAVEQRLIQLIVANPRIMRDLAAPAERDRVSSLVDGGGGAVRQHRHRQLLGRAPPSRTARCLRSRAFFRRTWSTAGGHSRRGRRPTTRSSRRPATTRISPAAPTKACPADHIGLDGPPCDGGLTRSTSGSNRVACGPGNGGRGSPYDPAAELPGPTCPVEGGASVPREDAKARPRRSPVVVK